MAVIAAISCAVQPASASRRIAQPVEDTTLQQAGGIAPGAESAAELINVVAPAVLGGRARGSVWPTSRPSAHNGSMCSW